MKIRNFEENDYREVCELLQAQNVEPPAEVEELNGPCFIAEDDNKKIIGCIFALVGQSTKAYVDFLAVDSAYHGTMVFSYLLAALEHMLQFMGVKRYVFHVEKNNHKTYAQLYKYREKYGIIKLRDLHYFSKEIA